MALDFLYDRRNSEQGWFKIFIRKRYFNFGAFENIVILQTTFEKQTAL